jgi:PAS domain S-box-containing protein
MSAATDSDRPQATGSYNARTFLSLFALAITVPLLLLFGVLLLQSASAQRAQLEARVRQVLDASVNDVDREFDRDVTILRTLATSQAFVTEDWRTFYDQAQAGLQGRAYLVLVDASGRQLVNTYVPYGDQPAMTGDPETIRRIAQTKAPVVSNLFTSLVVKKPVFNVSIPILRDGHVRYVMSLGLLPEDLLALLNAQHLGADWVTLIWDADGVILARSRDNPRYVGKPLPQNMREQAQPAIIRTTNLDGSDVLHATAHSPMAGWGVGLNVPYALVTAPIRHSLLLWGAAALLAITIALLAGIFFARQITTSLSIAARAITAFGRGELVPLTGSRLKEADAFLVTLNNAQDARQKLTEELKQSRDWFETTLASIGDGVIATDPNGRVTFLNAVSQTLTGWTQAEAAGQPLETVFQIINEHTRRPVDNPALRAMREGLVVGLANHTVLISKDGKERPIDDAGSPIRDAHDHILGAVLIFRDITERRQVERERAAHARATRELAAIVESSDDAIVSMNLDGMISGWNRAAEQMYGYTVTEAVGQSIQVIIPEDLSNEEEKTLRHIRRGERVEHFETRRRRKDGTALPVSITVSPIHDDTGALIGTSKVARDITARKQIERERATLLESERTARQNVEVAAQQLQTALQAGRMGTWEYALRTGGVTWSPGLEAIHGYAPGTFPATFEAFQREIYPDDRDHVLSAIRLSVEQRRPHHIEYRIVRPDGATRWVEGRGQLFCDSENRPERMVGVCVDVTERKEAEQRERTARAEIEQANRLKDDFLAVLSHELRTPLNAVLGYSHLLSSGALNAERSAHALDAIQRNAHAQARLVESLLDLSRILAGKLELVHDDVDLSIVLKAAIDVIRPDAEVKELSLDVEMPVTVPIVGDGNRLQQVFWNLLSNAIKFTPHNGRISIRVVQEDSQVGVEISDTGSGISAEFLPHVFERFKQAGNHARRSPEGLGLGLALVREMVQAHGGSVAAQSRGEGHGSTFTVRLPVGTPTAEPRVPEPDLRADVVESLQGIEILVVDDEADVRDLLALFLESRGANARVVASAQEAHDAIRQRRPDVLLADLRMPDEDGVSLIERLRAEEREQQHARLPAIAVTAYAGAGDRQRAIAAGYDAHVAKPVDPSELARAIIKAANAEHA